MNLAAIKKLVAKGEFDRVEFKKSTAQLKGAGQTLCAFKRSKNRDPPGDSPGRGHLVELPRRGEPPGDVGGHDPQGLRVS